MITALDTSHLMKPIEQFDGFYFRNEGVGVGKDLQRQWKDGILDRIPSKDAVLQLPGSGASRGWCCSLPGQGCGSPTGCLPPDCAGTSVLIVHSNRRLQRQWTLLSIGLESILLCLMIYLDKERITAQV